MNDRANAGRGARSAATVPTLLQSAWDRLPVGFALFDSSFHLVAWNARFAVLRGYPRKLLKAGTALESFVRFDAERGEYGGGAADARTRDRLATLKRRRRADREQALPDGRVVRIATERVPEGGLLVICEDVTDERRARDAATTALAEQTVLREVLEAISRSAFDLDAVLRTLIESAARLCRADKAFIFRLEGDAYRLALDYGGVAQAFRDFIAQHPIRAGRDTLVGRTALTKSVVHIEDVLADPGYRWPQSQRIGGQRSMLGMPILRDDVVVGVIALWKDRVEPFTPAQIQLVSTFSRQASIAIENARLFGETKEALERQTATGEILQAIARAPTNLQQVLDTVVRNAARLCEADNASLFRVEGDSIRLVVRHGSVRTSLAVGEARPISRGSMSGRAILDRKTINVPDYLELDLATEYPDVKAAVESSGIRTCLATPLVCEGVPIGALTIYQTEVRPYSASQIELVQLFADQAVIAIENVRLFKELEARNRELSESLEQQTATAEILKVISSSPTDVQPVLDAVASTAARLCDASDAVIFRVDGDQLRRAAKYGESIPAVAFGEGLPLDRRTVNGRAAVDRGTIHVHDLAVVDEAEYPLGREYAIRDGFRTALATPLLREGQALGTIHIRRTDVRPFTDKQIKLLEIFASQAAIAIENVRLFNETKESLAQQTATAEILRAISASPTSTEPVFDVILENGTRLCNADLGLLFRYEAGVFRAVATLGASPDFDAYLRQPIHASPQTGLGRVAASKAPIHIPDLVNEAAYRAGDPLRLRSVELGGVRTWLGVPMLREGELIGVITIYRKEVRPFDERQVAVLRTFADQAVIAIENVRRFNETKEALDHQKASAEVLQVISSSVADTKPVFDKILESCERLFAGRNLGICQVGDDGAINLSAYHGPNRDELMSNFPVPLSESSGAGTAILQRRVVQYPDTEAPGVPESVLRGTRIRGDRSAFHAPMLWEGRAIGSIFVSRPTVGEFSEKEIALLKTFADQAVIAVQNARLFTELEARNRDLTEALDREKATAEILRVISGSPTDVQPVFDAIARSGVRLFQGVSVVVRLVRDGRIERVAFAAGGASDVTDDATRPPFAVDDRSFSGRAVLRREVIRATDILAEDWLGEDARRSFERMGVRAVAAAPLMRENEAIGAILATRAQPGPFNEKELALLRTFADQAVIAIENVRLFNETKEALEKQTAISEILRVISASPTDVQPVFDAIVRSAVILCDTKDGAVFRYDGERLHYAAGFNQTPEWVDAVRSRYPMRPEESTIAGRAVLRSSLVQIDDVLADPAYDRERAIKGGWRRMLAVPMLRDGAPLGVIVVSWPQPGPTPKSQEDLLKTFADQAVIAIENVRLFNETKEALDHQKASAEILQVISSSVADTKPVFEKILESCERLFVGKTVGVSLVGEGGLIHVVAYHGPHAQPFPVPLTEASASGSAILQRRVMHYPDVEAPGVPDYARRGSTARGDRALLVAPMLWEGRGIGVIFVGRSTVGEFSEKEIALLKTFAGQAVIAIQNVRLFNETKEALDQLKASAEVLQVISSSVADTQPVFDKILESCQRLFEGRNVGITLVGNDGAVHLGPYRGFDRRELEGMYPLPLSRASGSGSAILERRVMHYPDVEHGDGVPEPVKHGSRIIGLKSIVFAPMLWEGRGIGAIFVGRATAGEFSEKEIALLKTFADQAVIAIQNARLFSEIREKSHQLEVANQHKSAFLANMSHELRTPLNAVIGFSEMLAARYFGALTDKQAEYVNDIHGSGKHLLSLINDILDLSKIEAGRMELEASDFDLCAALDNALTLVRERAQRGGIAVRLETDPALGPFHGDERKVKQVVLNLLSNAVKFTPRGGAVSVTARRANGAAEIAVTDTGVGIAPADQEAIFEAFRQVGTDVTRKREGTGLGLALTRRFVELHGGTIRVESEPGKGSTFTVTLPLRHGE